MIRALFTSATGLTAQQTVVDSTANNLANVNTTGFKRNQPSFQDLIYTTERTPGVDAAQGLQSPIGLQVGNGVRISGNAKVFTIGALDNTSSPLDVAIQGEGFIKVTMPSGEVRYTRDGNFQRNGQGELVTSDGFRIEPNLRIPQNAMSVMIGQDGTVSVTTPGSNAPTQVGQLTLARFANPAGLSAQGRNLFAETAASGAPTDSTPGQDGTGLLQQGFLERANVEVVREMVNLILAQRAYEFNTRAIRTADEMLSATNNLSR